MAAGPRRPVVAVVGVGLIGGSIGLAARERLERRRARLRSRPTACSPRALAAGAVGDALRLGRPRRVDGADVAFVAAPVGALPSRGRRGARGGGRGLRRLRRRLDQAVGRRGGRRSAVRRRAPARRRRDRGRRARARGPVRRRDLVPDADARAPAGSSTSACTACSSTSARARRRSTPTRTTRCWPRSRTSRTCSPTCSSRAPRGCSPTRASGCRRPARRSATPRAWPAPTPRSGATSTSPTPTRWWRRSTTPSRGWARCARRWRRATATSSRPGTTARATSAGGCWRPTWPAARCTSCASAVPNRPGVVAEVALALGRAGVNILDMALYPAPDHSTGTIALWIAGERHAVRGAGARRGPRADGGARRERALLARRAAARHARRAARQVAVAPRGADGGDDRRAGADHRLPRRGRHELDARRRAGARRAGRARARTRWSCAGVGLRAAAPAAGPIDVGNAGHADAAAAGLARRAGGRDVDARRRRVDPPPPGRPRRGAAGADGRADRRRRDGRFPPFTITGSPLRGIEYELPVASAQVKSCVLLAGLLASGPTTVVEPVPTPRPHRADARRRRRADRARRRPRSPSPRRTSSSSGALHVPGDPSSAAFLAAAAVLVPGSRIVLEGMAANWTRTGFFRILQRMGAVVVGPLEEPSRGRPGRRAGDRARRRARAAGRHRGRAGGGAAGDRRAAAGRAARLLRRGRRRSCAARRSCG